MPELEYLIIYQRSGLPIWSKCFGTICSLTAKDPALLSGFLAALESFSTEIDKEGTLETVKMGKSIMNFERTTPSGHSIVIGTSKDNKKLVGAVFKEAQELLETNYGGNKLDYMDHDIFSKEFEKELLKNTLISALHDHGGFDDSCPLGDQCLMKTSLKQKKKGKIWQIIGNTYKMMKEKMMKK